MSFDTIASLRPGRRAVPALLALAMTLACAPGIPYPPRLDMDESVLEIGDAGDITELTPESQNDLLRYYDFAVIRPGDRVQFAFQLDPPPKPASRGYRIEQADILQVLFVDNYAYNSFVTVRPDGYVSPTGIRDVLVAGRTVEDVTNEMNQLYMDAGVLGEPGVSLSVNYIDPQFVTRFNADLLVYEDGTVLHPILGRFEAAGLIARDLEEEAHARMSGRVMNAVRVLVQSVPQSPRAVFVGGEIQRQGRYDYTRHLTLSQIVFEGGVKDTADLLRVVLMRRGRDGRLHSYVVNLVRNFEPGAGRGAVPDVAAASFASLGAFEVPVRPDDVVYVPKTSVARMNQFVDEWMNKMIPFQKAVSASYTYGKFEQP